ncbi:PHP domain-containing protein [Kineosporia succinea]|uniref:Metal-dependent phosphoesterase TrpH n=1 Tax=Kineosporia succinea TaxID=84632 RepID=A0ABT9NYE0_9ACTN|nr:PHP domain-containing protein [Kineosporia succinea]MDP9825453.1 putative metal-dependent phosphoesterase TrpH [Kineosporia succinea]
MRIDLHAHSSASDGTDSPAGVMEAAAAAGLDVVALTDHDTMAGVPAAAPLARELGLTLVPGAEISCQMHGIGVHMLGYLHDPDDEALLAEEEQTKVDRLTRAQRMVERLSVDFDISWDDVVRQCEPDAAVGRPHIADALVAAGAVKNRDEAFATVLHGRSPYYLPYHAPEAALIVRLVREAGGVPVMAHPRAGKRGRLVSDADIAELAEVGLVGVEVNHRDHAESDRTHLRRLAAGLGLLTTGSSDYHGTGKVNRIGENTTDPAVFEKIVALGTPERVVRP